MKSRQHIPSSIRSLRSFTTIGRKNVFILIVIPAYFAFGLHHIDKFITADEHYWLYERIPRYWTALSDGNWKGTHINDKPGISLALISGIGLLHDNRPDTICWDTSEKITSCNASRIENTLFAFRLPLLIVNAFLLIYIFRTLRTIYNERTAILGASFMALSPILIGITQIVNPDALLWSLGTASFLSFLALLKHRGWRLAVFSGLFLGFAILSKYTASLLIPFYFLLVICDPFFRDGEPTTDIRRLIMENVAYFLTVTAIGILTICVFLPAVLFKPEILVGLISGGDAFFSPVPYLILGGAALTLLIRTSRGTVPVLFVQRKIKAFSGTEKFVAAFIFFSILILITGRILYPEWDVFQKVPFDLKDLYGSDKPFDNYYPSVFEAFLLELNPLIYSTPPLLVFSFLFGLSLFLLPTRLLPYRRFSGSEHFQNFALLMFLLSFLVIMQLSEVLATPRYLILLYPVVAILSAFAIDTLLTYRTLKTSGKIRARADFVLIAFSIISIAASAPFYFNYTNFLLPKDKLIQSAWGYGGYEAAQYLNSLPGAEKMLIWSDYNGVCEFFKGKCVIMEYKDAAKQRFDYAVLSNRGRSLYRPEHSRWQKAKNLQMSSAYAASDPAWRLDIGGRPENFIEVVKIDNP